jgi:biotin synthase
MKIDTNRRVYEILDRCLEGHAPAKPECIELLSLPEGGLDAALLRSVANEVSRKRFGNRAMLLGQIGIETFPCPANCKFCVFGEKHTQFPKTEMEPSAIKEAARLFTAEKDLYALFLMVMHTYDEQRLIQTVEAVRKVIPSSTSIVLNMGDFSLETAKNLAAAGVSGMYHVWRLREGTDTELEPENRKKTIKAIKDAGLNWYYCCEPIGPEHTAEELADHIFLGAEYECFQHAAMRRVTFPGSPLSDKGMITELRLAQVTAVTILAMIANPALQALAVHEPNPLGLMSGANSLYAEAGANPRDTSENTKSGRGLDTADCKRMFMETGFDSIYNAHNEVFNIRES